MNVFARFSLANRALVALAAIIVALAGLWSATTLKQELMPSLDVPVVGAITVYPGASPEIIDEQVTQPIAQAASGVAGVERTNATSNANVSTVMLELDYGTDSGAAQQELQAAIARLAGTLPEAADSQVITGSIDDLPVVQLAVTADADQDETAQVLRDIVVPDIEALDGVRDATLTGTREQHVTIDVDPEALAEAGVSPDAIGSVLQANGMVIPAGSLTTDERTLSVQVGDRLTSAEDVAALPVPTESGPVALDSIADVALADAEQTSLSRTNGQPSFGISVTRTPDGNTVEISEQVADLLPELETALGQGAEISIVFDQAPFIEQSVEDLTVEGMLGLVFAVIVILLFLRAWRPTAVTALSIPMSLLIALVGLKFVDYSLNLFTLAALTVSIGRVVDDSIVVIENIERHLSYGQDRRTAVLRAVREVAGAITSATVATAAVFVPMGLVGGMVGELFRPFAFTVALALMASLLVALTIVPVLAWWFLPAPKDTANATQVRAEAEAKERRGWLQRGFGATLRAVLARPVVTIIVALGILGGTVALVPQMETEFIGDTGENSLVVTQTLPTGTSLAARDEAAAEVEEVIAELDGVQTYQVNAGAGDSSMMMLGMGGGDDASFSITLDLDADAVAIEADLRSRLADLADAGDLSVAAGMAGFSPGLEVIVTAADPDDLASASEAVRNAVADVPDTADVGSNLAEDLPTITVSVDRDAAAEVGLTEAQISQSVAAALSGATLGSIYTDAGASDVVLRIGQSPLTVDDLADLPVGSVPPAGADPGELPEGLDPGDLPEGVEPGDLPEGVDPGDVDPGQLPGDGDFGDLPEDVDPGDLPMPEPVLLSDVAEVEELDLPASITRVNGQRSATVTAASTATDLGSQTLELQSAMDDLDLPEGTHAELGGVSADQDEAFASLYLALLLSLAIVYLVMVATFRSLLQPLILMISVPFAATGAIALLLVTGTPLGVAGMIGALMLVGVVVTNAIVLIDLINQYRSAGMGLRTAIEEGARHRLRPILMTAAATIGALTPMAFGVTGGSAFISQPLALVVIGGLITSTFLTLLLVPVLYWLVERRRERRQERRDAKVAGKHTAAAEPAEDVVEVADGVAVGTSTQAAPVEETSGRHAAVNPQIADAAGGLLDAAGTLAVAAGRLADAAGPGPAPQGTPPAGTEADPDSPQDGTVGIDRQVAGQDEPDRSDPARD